MKNTTKKLIQKILTANILVAVFFFGIPGIGLIPKVNKIFNSKNAEAAADYGRETRTAEFLLSLGTETTARATNVISFTSANGWSTSEPSLSSGDIITLLGKNIKVDSAQLELAYYTTAVAVSKQDIYLKVENSSSPSFVAAGEYIGMGATTLPTGGLTGYANTLHNITSFFDRQTDAQFQNGVHLIAKLNVTGPQRFGTTMKVIITYSVDVEEISHNLVKTVKLPLLSATNRGTRATTCAASATCTFTFDLTKIPELTNKSQILSTSVDIFSLVNATSAQSFRMTGSNATTTFTFAEGYTDSYTTHISWNPLSDSYFSVGAVQSLDIVNGTAALYALGGEVSITYSFDATLPLQTDTLNYFVSQGTALPAATLTQFSTSTINITNQNAQIQTAWYRIGVSPSVTTANLNVTHRVNSSLGNSVGTLVTYALNAGNTRVANTPTIIHVLDESSNRYSSNVNFGGQYQFSASAGSAPASVSAYITFTWNATDILASRTKTVIFGASQKGPGRNVATSTSVAATSLIFGEHSEKMFNSIFLDTSYTRFDTTSITGSGQYTTRVRDVSFTINEGAIVEPHRKNLLDNISPVTLFGSSTSTDQSFSLNIAQFYNGADYTYQANYIVVTYSFSFTLKPDPIPRQTRTVEYVLGGGTDDVARASNSLVYFGNNSISASPTMLPVQLFGSKIKVVNAYVDVSFIMATSASAQTTNDITILGSSIGTNGSQNDIILQEDAGSQLISSARGITGYYHGQHNVTSLFAEETNDATWNSGGVQVKFGIKTIHSAGNRTLTSMKLVVTYETDFNLSWHDEVKTVRIPLQSVESIGTRATPCTMGSDCNFTYSRSIPDLASIISSHFEVTAQMDGTVNPSIYLASNGATSPNFTATETSNDSTALRYLWQIPTQNLDATTTPNQTGTLTFHNGSGSALNMYGIGGELIITYRYNTASVSQLETLRFPVGQQVTAAFAKTIIGTSTPYISNQGASVRDAWIRYYSAPYGAGNITFYGKLGSAPERSLVASSTVVNRSGGERMYYLNLAQDIGSFSMPTTNISASIAFTSGSQYPTGAEAFVNYIWDGSKSGTTTKSIIFPAEQHSSTNVAGNAPQVKPTPVYLPKNVNKVFRSAYSRTAFHHDALGSYGGTFALGPAIIFGINNATTSITSVGDLYSYNSVLIKEYTQNNLFGTNLPEGRTVLRVENSAQTANPLRFSNEVIITYDELQELRRAAFSQDAFRLYVNKDDITPSDSWHTSLKYPLGESQGMTSNSRPVRKSDVVRLRMGMTVGTSTLSVGGQTFQLQYGVKTSSCSAIDVSWEDVTSSSAWVGHDNSSQLSSTPITSLLLSSGDVFGLYSENGLTGVNPNAVNIGQMVEYDWVIKRNTATSDTDYCFRAVEGGGKKLSSYTYYPLIRTAGYTPETTNWRWYDDELNETPNDNPAWTLNSAALGVVRDNIVKLRVGLFEIANESGNNEKFALQYSADPTFESGVDFVTTQDSCNSNSTYCYADSPSIGDDDNAILSTSKLGILRGVHNESTSTATFSPAANTHYEMEFSIKPVKQRTGQLYYFRLWDTKRNAPIRVNDTYSSPVILAEGPTLGVTVSGVSSGSIIAGATMSSSTTNTTLPFGLLSLDTSSYLAHLINIKTNAFSGYTAHFVTTSNLQNSSGDIIPPISSSNSSPTKWSESCPISAIGCVGYHTTDNSLNPTGITDRFEDNDTWAELATSTQAEIGYGNGPTGVLGDEFNIIYRVEPRMGVAPGEYSTNVLYIATPVY